MRYFLARGCSWAGNITRRDGKSVSCSHKHKTRAAASRCAKSMRLKRPGNCQDYRAFEIVLRQIRTGGL